MTDVLHLLAMWALLQVLALWCLGRWARLRALESGQYVVTSALGEISPDAAHRPITIARTQGAIRETRQRLLDSIRAGQRCKTLPGRLRRGDPASRNASAAGAHRQYLRPARPWARRVLQAGEPRRLLVSSVRGL